MINEKIAYRNNDTVMQGELFYQEGLKEKRPCVLVAHAWRGRDAFAIEKAKSLAELGYVGFALDLYGEAKEASNNDEALALMLPLFLDRARLLGRLKAAFDVVKRLDQVDPAKIGGIGFCFGGLSIIELFRSGAPLAGVVSFHAVLGTVMAEQKAKTLPIASNIKGSLLILHGYDDPLVSAQDIERCQKELTQANVDWQMHLYGHTSHAFTVPQAHDKSMGLMYNPIAEKRSWIAMKNFFDEMFSK